MTTVAIPAANCFHPSHNYTPPLPDSHPLPDSPPLPDSDFAASHRVFVEEVVEGFVVGGLLALEVAAGDGRLSSSMMQLIACRSTK